MVGSSLENIEGPRGSDLVPMNDGGDEDPPLFQRSSQIGVQRLIRANSEIKECGRECHARSRDTDNDCNGE